MPATSEIPALGRDSAKFLGTAYFQLANRFKADLASYLVASGLLKVGRRCRGPPNVFVEIADRALLAGPALKSDALAAGKVFIVGLSGTSVSGKSTVAKRMSSHLDRHARFDVSIYLEAPEDVFLSRNGQRIRSVSTPRISVENNFLTVEAHGQTNTIH